ncbi:anaerobic ribonucleoside-triphosphate reductase activating protein [Oxalobacteraceae bacterium A2-2]
MGAAPLNIGGWTPFSAAEYPALLSAVVFVQGCPWRCGYCHNPQLQPRTREPALSWEALLSTLRKRVGLLDAVVFCGGEPTVDPALAQAVAEVRALGYRTGLETAGIYPQRLREVLPLLDWVGFDVKAPFARYADVTGVAGSGDAARSSLRALLASSVAYECRTTVHPALLPPAVLLELAYELRSMGVRNYVLQEFRAIGCRDKALSASAMAGYPGAGLAAQIAPHFERFHMRRNN